MTVTCVVVSSAASSLVLERDPQLALRLNPFATNARVALVGAALDADSPPPGERLESAIAKLIALAPGDARGYSLLASLRDRQGRSEEAKALYARALAQSHTEPRALFFTLSDAIAAGRYVEAVGIADILLRRWGDLRQDILPAVGPVIADPAGRQALLRTLADDPPWRNRVFDHLLTTPLGLSVAETLVLSDRSPDVPPRSAEVARLIAALVRANAQQHAYRLFLLTLSPEERAVSGYVHDPAFSRPPGGRYFDWTLRPSSGVDISIAGSQGGGLAVRFLDSPARLGNLTQTLVLPPGHYQLQARADARSLVAPRGVFWQLRCAAGEQAPLATLELAPGSYSGRTFAQAVEVPAEGCGLQILSLRTGVTTDSWRERYRGAMRVASVSIVRM